MSTSRTGPPRLPRAGSSFTEIVAFSLLLALGGSGDGWGQEGSETRRHELKVTKKAIFLSDDGEVVEIEGHGDGNDFTWSVNGEVLRLEGDGGVVHLASLGLGRGFLGVSMVALTDALRAHFGVPEGVGVMISEVVAGSPAELAGLAVGDIVTAIDGDDVVAPGDLSHAVRSKGKDELVDLEVWRGGKVRSLVATVEERERPVVKLGRHGSEITVERLGEPRHDEHEVMIHLDQALGQMQDYFVGDEWKARVQRLGNVDWAVIEARMKALEEQIRELEKKLEQAQR